MSISEKIDKGKERKIDKLTAKNKKKESSSKTKAGYSKGRTEVEIKRRERIKEENE